MITPEQHAEIRRLYFGEHWKVGTIVANLGVHPDTVRAAIALDTRVVRRSGGVVGRSWTRISPSFGTRWRSIRGYAPRGSTRCCGRAAKTEARRINSVAWSACSALRSMSPLYRRLVVLPAEEAQVDWGAFR